MVSKQNLKSELVDRQTVILNEEKIKLDEEGLCIDPLFLPLPSLYDMFESLLKSRDIPKYTIKRKLQAFYQFVIDGQITDIPKTFSSIISMHKKKIKQDLESETVFYNAYLIAIFSYIYGIRLQLYFIGKEGSISCQHFGIKKKPIKRIYMFEERYHILKKILYKTNTCSTRISKEIASDDPKTKKSDYIFNKYPISKTSNIIDTHPVFTNIRFNESKMKDQFFKTNQNQTDDYNSSVFTVPSGVQHIVDISKERFQCKNIDMIPDDTNIFNEIFVDTDSLLKSWSRNIFFNDIKEADNCTKINQSKNDISLGLIHESIEGKLKFYSEVKEYGFILMEDQTEVFVHKADLVRQNIDTKYLAYYNKFYDIFLRFDVEEYQGRVNIHRKAINMTILSMNACV